MATQILDQSTVEEKLIWFGLVLTYPVYMVGGLYVFACVTGWLVLIVALLRFYVEGTDEETQVPAMVWLWIAAMLLMEIALLVGHANWDLGIDKAIKSTFGWAKGWALLALYPLLGSAVKIRREIVVRGVCVIGAYTLGFALLTVLAYFVHLPAQLFISPLQAIGGPGDEFFKVCLYGINPETGAGRWQFFCPWAPAAGMLADIYLVFCLLEKNRTWRYIGIAGCLVMCMLSQSRTGMIIFPFIFPLMALGKHLNKPWLLLTLGIAIPVLFVAGQPVYEFATHSYEEVKAARPGSSRVRGALGRLAIQRWRSEAPVWGHGIVERGPKIVERMPIGSHHTWYGLLFVKGLVGLIALAVPMACSLLYLMIEARRNYHAHSALVLLLIIGLYSFYENLEILSYLYWPALLWIGMAFNPLKTGEPDNETL